MRGGGGAFYGSHTFAVTCNIGKFWIPRFFRSKQKNKKIKNSV